MSPVLVVDRVRALLRQVVEDDGSPHSASLVSIESNGVVATVFVEPRHPKLTALLNDDDGGLVPRGKTDGEREAIYCAVALSGWTDAARERQEGDKKTVLIENELGRMAVTQVTPSFVLVLTGIRVAPWSVLEKKSQLVAQHLAQPLSKLAARGTGQD